MAINLLTGNLNQWGSNGTFEADQSTWGFYIDGVFRDGAERTQGLFAAKRTVFGDFASLGSNVWLSFGLASLVTGRRYLATVKVKTLSSNPVANGSTLIGFEIPFLATSVTVVNRTVTQATDNWATVEIFFTAGQTGNTGINLNLKKSVPSDELIFGGAVWADEFYIYEYEEVPDPPPLCTLLLNVAGSVVVNESAPGAADGSITIATTGGTGTLQYSFNNGTTWQAGNQLTGLVGGVYQCRVREVANTACEASYAFTVNQDEPGEEGAVFTISAAVTNETSYGANDGTISITVTGTGAPFTFSKDSGLSYQSSNVYTNLSPGIYYLVAKADDGTIRVTNVTVLAGILLYQTVRHINNPITRLVNAAANWREIDNYRLYCDIRVEDPAGSNVFVSMIKNRLTPDNDDKVIFNAQAAFRDLMYPQVPETTETTLVKKTDRSRAYKFYTGVLTGDLVTPASLTESLIQLAVYGGVSKRHFPGLEFFTNHLNTTKQFLTWAPKSKVVYAEQDDYLTFFNYRSNVNQLKLQLTCYYDDNTSTVAVTKTLAGINYADIVQVPSGPTNSGARGVEPEKVLTRYTLVLLSQTNEVVSEVRTYVVQLINPPQLRFYLFLNSLGSYESIAFTGKSSKSAEVTRETVQLFLPVDYTANNQEMAVNSSLHQLTESLSTGYFEGANAREWQAYMLEFIRSKKVYESINGKRYLKIVSTTNVPLADDEVYEAYTRLEVKDPYIDENYTPEIL